MTRKSKGGIQLYFDDLYQILYLRIPMLYLICTPGPNVDRGTAENSVVSPSLEFSL